MSKLEKLANIEGYNDPLEMLSAMIYDTTCPGICSTAGCNYTAEVEPDQDRGWCEECRRNSVMSGLVLAGII